MAVVLEEMTDIQYITDKSGEKTAIVIPLDNNGEQFRQLLTKFIESRSFNDIDSLIKLEKSFHDLMILVQSSKNPVILKELETEIENLIEKIDEKLEDEFDLSVIAERKNEETVTHEDLKAELKDEGFI